MSRIVKIICLVLALVSLPMALMMAMFSPALLGGGTSNMTFLQKATGGSIVIVLLALPIWIVYFMWRTIRSWSSESNTPAFLAALPACLVIAFFAVVNFVKFGP